MKDALKAVASTNGRHLCGGRVRVELTPIDEKEDNKRRMLSKDRMKRKNMRSTSPSRPQSDMRRSPSPTPPNQRGGIPRYTSPREYISPRRSPSPPIVRHNRHTSVNSPPPFPPHPKRHSSQSGRRHYDDQHSYEDSPVREPIPRRPLPPPSPPPSNRAPLERKRDKGLEHRHYREGRNSRGSGSSDVSRSSGKFSSRKDVHIARERYSSSRNVSLDSSPSDVGHFSHHHTAYEGSMSPVKIDRDQYDHYPHGTQHTKQYSNNQPEDSINSPFYTDNDPLPPAADVEYTRQTSWNPRKRARYDYHEEIHHSPPPLSSTQSRSVNHKKGSSHHGRYKHFKDDQQQQQQQPMRNETGYGAVHHEVNYHEQSYQQRSLSPSPPPPPPPPPPMQSSRRKSAKYNEGHSSVHHNESRGRKKGRESGRHHKHYHRRNSGSPPPVYSNNNRSGQYLDNNQYRYVKHGDTACEQRYQNKDVPSSPPRLKGQQYYEQIDEGTDGFFSEVGYHSPPQRSPSHQLPYGMNPPELLTVDGRPVTSHHHIDNNSFELQNEGADYDDRSTDEHFLQIDEVKGSSDREDHSVVSHGGQYRSQQKEREIVYNSGQSKDREVIHRKREREVIVKRSPERNRSRTPPISM